MWQRVRNILRTATLTAIDDSGPVQTAQIASSYLETFPPRPVIQQFGLASNPPANSDGLLFSPSGDPANGVVLGHNSQAHRPTGQPAGGTTLYDAFGNSVVLTQGTVTAKTSAGMSVTLSASGIAINPAGQPVTIDGDLHVSGAVIAGYGGADQVGVQTHLHPSNGAPPTPGT